LYQNTGRNALEQQTQQKQGPESGYTKLGQHDGPEAYELTEHDQDHDRDLDLASGSGDDDATKIGREDEVDWIDRRDRTGVRI
jgi:hypothetical protein